jgi:hypothetical protein
LGTNVMNQFDRLTPTAFANNLCYNARTEASFFAGIAPAV